MKNGKLNIDTDEMLVIDGVLKRCSYEGKELIIPEGVEKIDCKISVKDDDKVILPKSLKEISIDVFATGIPEEVKVVLCFSNGKNVIIYSDYSHEYYPKLDKANELEKEAEKLDKEAREYDVRAWDDISWVSQLSRDAENLRKEAQELRDSCRFPVRPWRGLIYAGNNFSECIRKMQIKINSSFDEFLKKILLSNNSGIFRVDALDLIESYKEEKTIIIAYKDFDELLKIIQDEALYDIFNFVDLDQITIAFVGPYFLNKDMIEVRIPEDKRNLFKFYLSYYRIIEIIQKYNSLENFYQNPQEIYDDEINSFINKILETSIDYPVDKRMEIWHYVNHLVSKYLEDVKKAKPRYDQTRDMDFNDVDIDILRSNLIASLIRIQLKLPELNVLNGYLIEICECEKNIESGGKDLVFDDSIAGYVDSMMYFLSHISDGVKTSVVNRLTVMLNEARDKILAAFSLEYDSAKIKFDSIDDVMPDLKKKVIGLLDEVQELEQKALSFYEFLDEINNDTDTTEFKRNEGIAVDINNARYIISKISDETVRNKSLKELNELLSKYRVMLEDILNDENKLKNTDYDEFELQFRSEFHTFLSAMRNYIYLDRVDKAEKMKMNARKKTNKLGIGEQLLKAVDIVMSNYKYFEAGNIREIEISSSEEDQIVISFVVETYNSIVSNQVFTLEDKKKMLEDLISSLHDVIENLGELDSKKTSFKEYNEMLKKVLGPIAKVRLDTLLYESRIKNYNRKIK